MAYYWILFRSTWLLVFDIYSQHLKRNKLLLKISLYQLLKPREILHPKPGGYGVCRYFNKIFFKRHMVKYRLC